ncbi:serine-rich adhesin for platelets-like isoform X1 [Cherax quadricarinatus]|uniref:serine-rich adhesin for platelets-like isoform X1 n=1 Tax=Cherax quadricarinatus TaxID=27406 RepID=UPI00387E4539
MAKMLRMFNSLRRNKEKKKRYKRSNSSPNVDLPNGQLTESGGSEERARDTRSDHHSSDRDKSENSDTRFVIHETYEADRDILRSDPEDDDETSDSGTEASEDSPQRHTDSSLNLSNISGDSNRGLSGETEGSNESDEGSSTDQGSQTDTSTDTLVADVIQYQADLVDLTEAAFVEYDQATGARIEHPGTQVTYNEYGHTLCAYQEYPKNCLSRRVLNQTFCDLEGYSTLHETFCEKDEITGALIEHPNDSSDEEIQPHFYEDSSSFTENGDSFFLNFEEELEQAERQYPNLQVEHLLINQEKEEEDEPKVEEIHWWGSETAKEVSRYSTITEEGEEEEIVVVVPRGKLETTAMGQYYSSASGGGPSGGEVSGSLASSLRSSEEWRISLASTVTVASTATADSDDTLAKDMSELSSVNSRLSSLDEAQDEVKGHPIVDSNVKGMIQTDHRRQTSIRDAIDELESIEQAAQTLLQNQQFSTDDGRGAPVSDTHTINSSGVSFTEVNLSAKLSPLSKRKLPQSPLLLQDADNHETLPEKSEKTPQLGTSANNKTETVSPGERVYQEIPSTKADKDGLNQKTENLCYQENVVINGDSKTTTRNVEQVLEVKAEVKPPLPPTTGSQLSKFEVKRRFLSRSKELKPYISRESYNDELVLKDLERLRRSYQEGDLNDFLDALENTPISDDIEEAFLRQLLVDISENVEGLPQESEDSSEPKEETEIVQQKSSAQPENEVPTEPSHGSSSASTLENVKERIREIITIRKAGRVIGTGNCEEPSIQKDDSKASTYPSKEDLCPSETLQTSRPITPQSLRPDTPNSKSSRPQTPDSSTKGDDGKKSFNIAEFLKKGSPKYLREKYKERKNRKSDVITTSESESEDPDGGKKDIDQGNSASQKNGSLTEYQSSLKGSNRSLNSSQELKKEVRFEFDTDGERREVENSNCKDSTTDSKISEAVELKIQHTCIGPQVITYEAQQQETVVLKETTEELESEAGFTLPSTVEDINNLAQTLLPRLPERVKPSRKKKKLIPASVEELSTGDIFNSTSTLASNGLQKADTESLIINTTVKEESPPPLPHYEELLELPKTSTRCVAVVERDRSESHSSVAREESEDSRVTNKNTVHTESPQRSSSIAMTQLPDCTMTSSPSVTTVTPDHITTTTTLTSSAINAASESVAADSTQSFLGAVPSAPTLSTPIKTSIVTSATDVQVLVSPLTVTPVASISVAPTPENATLLVYPARTLPLPVIPESLQEDQVSLPTPSEPTVSFSSHGGSAPVTPQDEEENVPSLYDNVNPFKEMREMESKPLQDVAPEPLPVTNITVEIETETTEIETITLSQQLKDENLSHHFSLPQEACKSPDSEKSLVVDIDALTALTAEMFSFAHDMDKCLPHKENDQLDHSKASAPEVSMVTDTLKSDNKSEYLTDRGSGGSVTACVAEVSEAAVSTTYLTKQQEDIKKKKETKETVTQTELDDTSEAISVKERAKSNTIAIQTDATRYVRTYEASSQTDTEYETDFETESEMEENSSSRYDVSKWLFQPAREKKLPLSTPKDPQLQELHKQQQAMIMELQQQCLMQERRQREKPEVPPRQFQEKMPLKVVDELKTVLSEVEEVGAKLKKVADPSPHWDSDLKWNNVSTDDLATIPEEVPTPCARAEGSVDVSQQAQHLPSAHRKHEAATTTTHLQIPAKHVKGNDASVDLKSTENITTAKIRANVYPFFAPVKIPRGKPPVPRPAIRRLSGEGQMLEEGYQSDPGARRNNGRHKQVSAKVKPSTPTSEDRGYATDTDIMKTEHERQTTLGSAWTPSGQPAQPELHQSPAEHGKRSVELTPQATPAPVEHPYPKPHPIPSSPTKTAFAEPLSLRVNISRLSDVVRAVADIPGSDRRLCEEILSRIHQYDFHQYTAVKELPTPPVELSLKHPQLSGEATTYSVPAKDNRDVPLSQEQSPPPLPSLSPSPPMPHRSLLAPGTGSVDRGLATAESLYPCQPSHAQSGSTTHLELSYRTERPRRPLTWCSQFTSVTFSHDDQLHHLTTAAHAHQKHPNLPGNRAKSSNNKEEVTPIIHLAPGTRPVSFVGPYGWERLKAQGLAEWLFFARLDRTNKNLSQLPSSMELKPSPLVNGSSEVNDNPSDEVSPEYSNDTISREDIVKCAKYPSAKPRTKPKSPPPPPRPRTPIDERDPELVYAERRYLSYFEDPPYKRRQIRSISQEPPKPTYQQLEAQRRYNNFFLGTPQASTPTRENVSRSPEPDLAQLEAQRRYESYFHPGPPRSRSTKSPEPAKPDAQQLEAERRYLSYFNTGPPRARSSSQVESSREPDAEQLEAERRYLKYFNPGPPRPTCVNNERTPEPDAEQLEAERRYLAYFRSGPPRQRPRPSSMSEASPEPDPEQQEAERRYLSYFKPGPPRPRPRSDIDIDRKPDQQQLEAEKRYMTYFQGTPKAKRKTDEEKEREDDGKLRVPPTREMLEAEERFLSYFKPIPCGEPKRLITEPPLSEKDKVRQQLMKEYWEAMENRVDRKEKKIIKVSRPKREIQREATPPTQRELVVEEFLQRVKDRKKEKDLHYGDTDDEDDEKDGDTLNSKLGVPVTGDDLPTPIIEGGGEVKGRIVDDLGLFVSQEGE